MLVLEINVSDEKLPTIIVSTIKLLTFMGNEQAVLFSSDIVLLFEVTKILFNCDTYNLLVITL